MTSPGIDSCSLVPLYVEGYFGEQRLGGATAFPWLRTDLRLSLITNWHVVSGRNHETGKPMNPMGGVPDHLRVHVPFTDRALSPLIVTIPTVDGEGEPLWIGHPVHGQAVDVASLEFDQPLPEASRLMPMNLIKMLPLKQRIGMPVFVLGFPFERLGLGMPVWKQASLASEPYLLNFATELYLIVDTASRPGMSGSPVIQRVHGCVDIEIGRGHVEDGDGACNFIGIYSGRFHTNDASDAQLGRVWPARLVADVVEAARRARERRPS
jgi:hypothetical protein